MTLGSSEISKLHKQFSHYRSDKLLNLLKDTGHDAKLLGNKFKMLLSAVRHVCAMAELRGDQKHLLR